MFKTEIMNKLSILTAFFLLGGMTAFAQSQWTVDKAHAKLGFTVTHMSLSEVDGNFKKFDASITTSKPDFTDAIFSLTAEIASINTDNDMRDGHLKSDKYFDAAKYPNLTFKTSSITKIDAKKYKMIGNMTLHGVTKQVSLDLVLNGIGKSMSTQKPVAGFKITGTINRNDFGVGNAPAAIISDEIQLRATGEFEQN